MYNSGYLNYQDAPHSWLKFSITTRQWVLSVSHCYPSLLFPSSFFSFSNINSLDDEKKILEILFLLGDLPALSPATFWQDPNPCWCGQRSGNVVTAVLFAVQENQKRLRTQDEESLLAVLPNTARAEPSPACVAPSATACSETAGRHRAGKREQRRGQGEPCCPCGHWTQSRENGCDPTSQCKTQHSVKTQPDDTVEGHRPPRAAVTELACGSHWGVRVPVCKDNRLVFSSLAVTCGTFHWQTPPAAEPFSSWDSHLHTFWIQASKINHLGNQVRKSLCPKFSLRQMFHSSTNPYFCHNKHQLHFMTFMYRNSSHALIRF